MPDFLAPLAQVSAHATPSLRAIDKQPDRVAGSEAPAKPPAGENHLNGSDGGKASADKAAFFKTAQTIADDKNTGPSPAFQASLLEVESDLNFVIEQVEAAREKAANDAAISPNTGAPPTHDMPY